MKIYKCGWNTLNHTVTVMAVSEAQAKFKCKQLHGAYPDWTTAADYAMPIKDGKLSDPYIEGVSSCDIHATTAEMLQVSRVVAKTVNFGILYGPNHLAYARAHELSLGGQDG